MARIWPASKARGRTPMRSLSSDARRSTTSTSGSGGPAWLPSIALLRTIGVRCAAQRRGWSSPDDPVRVLQALDDRARHHLDLLVGCRPRARADLEFQA